VGTVGCGRLWRSPQLFTFDLWNKPLNSLLTIDMLQRYLQICWHALQGWAILSSHHLGREGIPWHTANQSLYRGNI
jgi:hypothetical protein